MAERSPTKLSQLLHKHAVKLFLIGLLAAAAILAYDSAAIG